MLTLRLPPVVHVTESFAGGTASAIVDYVNSVPERRHELIYAQRSGEPVSPEMLALFAQTTPLPAGHVRRVLLLRRLLHRRTGVIVHSHSSLGGTYVRMAVMKSIHRPLVHTPHCFAFERQDVSRIKRSIFKIVELGLAMNTNVFIACSPRERTLAARLNPFIPSLFVPNAVRTQRTDLIAFDDHVEEGKRAAGDFELSVVAAGRLSAQKDPDFLISVIHAARSLGLYARITWIGGGPQNEITNLVEADVSVTGWTTRSEARLHMKSADAYVHTAAWEGFPLTLLEAVDEGLPVVVRAIPAFDEIGLPLKASSPMEMAQALVSLTDPEERTRVRDASRAALVGNSSAEQSRVLRSAYGALDRRILQVDDKSDTCKCAE